MAGKDLVRKPNSRDARVSRGLRELTLWMPYELKQALKGRAYVLRVTPSELVRRLIEREVDRP